MLVGLAAAVVAAVVADAPDLCGEAVIEPVARPVVFRPRPAPPTRPGPGSQPLTPRPAPPRPARRWKAYHTIVAAVPTWPLAEPGTAIAKAAAFDGTNASFAASYARARQRLDRLAGDASKRSGCEIERLGCFSGALRLLTDIADTKNPGRWTERQPGGDGTPPAYAALTAKTLRRSMVNLLWLLDGCEAQARHQQAHAAAQQRELEGPVTYAPPPAEGH